MSQSKLVKFPGPGCIVEFLHSGQPQIAWVLEEQAGKLRLYTIAKRDLKLAAGRLLPWSGPAYPAGASRSVMEEAMNRHQAARLDQMRGIDPLEIWELAQGEVGKATAEWFAGLVSEAPGPDEVAAMGRCLLEAKSHFRFQPPDFEVFEADVVERRQIEQEAARLRERLASEGQEFFRELWNCKTSGRPRPKGPDQDVADVLRELLLARIADPDDERSADLWAGLRKGLPDHPFLALLLAEAWGLVPPHHNYLLDRAGYEPGDAWSDRFAQEIGEHRRLFAERLGEPEDTPFVSIDSPTTRDIDDAFYIRESGAGGGFRVSVALACPALTWEFGSPLDQAVADRATSLYLPEGSSHMLPEALGTDLYSLRQGEPRPALVLDFAVSAKGVVGSVAPRLAVIRVQENVSYESAEARIASGEDEHLAAGFRLAQGLRAMRLERGAIVIDRPEPRIMLAGTDGDQAGGEPNIEVDIELEKATPNSQLLVSELMILANAGTAIWAAEHGVPLLYRSQEVSAPAGLAGVWERPEDIQRVVRQMGCTSLETRPAPHASLAVPAYSPVSSPLRRYPDLLNLAQLHSFLASGAPRLDRAGLERLLPGLTSRLDVAGQVQRFRPRYWKLVYFRQRQKTQTWQGVVVEENGPYLNVSIPLVQVYIRAPRELFGERGHVGHVFRIKLGKIDPLTNEIRIAEAWEE